MLIFDEKIDLKILDIGSGFAVSQPILASASEWKPPSPIEYAETIGNLLRSKKIPPSTKLILEPGRSLVAEAGKLVTRVIAVKKRNKRYIAIVDAGINMIPGLPMYKYRIVSLAERQGEAAQYEIHGSLCEKLDFLGDCQLVDPQVGDILVFEAVGAYDMAARSFTFIRPRPAVIWIDKQDNFKLIRRAETVDDTLVTQELI